MYLIKTLTTALASSSMLPTLFPTPIPVPSTEKKHLQVRKAIPACDSACLRRLLYQTAYSSASDGVNLVMDAYDSHEWCFSNDNIDWCPEMINNSISGIVGRAMNNTYTPSPDIKDGDFLQQLDNVSRQAVVNTMGWASRTVNGTADLDAVDSGAVRALEWTMWHLLNDGSSGVDHDALEEAMAAYQTPGE